MEEAEKERKRRLTAGVLETAALPRVNARLPSLGIRDLDKYYGQCRFLVSSPTSVRPIRLD